MGNPAICPVCGDHHFTEADYYEVCPVCHWEDDPVQRRYPDYRGGANIGSLNEARAEWEQKKRQTA